VSPSDRCLEKLVRPAPTFAHLERDDLPGESSINGFVLGYSEELVLVQTITDFRNDGFCLVRRSDVTDLRCQEFEVHYQQILEKEGVVPLEGPGFDLDLSSVTGALASLRVAGEWVIIEREIPGDDYFLIGPLVRVGARTASVHHFDALGQFESTPTLVRLETLTKVVFGSDYLRVWKRHLPPPPMV
jgi:hypothetical protein